MIYLDVRGFERESEGSETCRIMEEMNLCKKGCKKDLKREGRKKESSHADVVRWSADV